MDGHRPWPRVVVTPDAWGALPLELAAGEATLLGLWGDAGAVHMAIFDEARATSSIATIECPRRKFPSVGAHSCRRPSGSSAPSTILVRAAAGWLAGPTAVARPRLLGRAASSRRRHRGRRDARDPYEFLPAEGEGLHQIPVGPVHAGIIEPGHFRFTANGETVVRLEQRLGYVAQGHRIADGRRDA